MAKLLKYYKAHKTETCQVLKEESHMDSFFTLLKKITAIRLK